MNVFEIYLNTRLGIDELASKICAAFGISDKCRREGDNRGGVYYVFEVFGLTLELLSNSGEVEIPERSSWPYYMLIYSQRIDLDQNELRVLTEYGAQLMITSGVEAEVDALS